MRAPYVFIILSAFFTGESSAHARWKCPLPRDEKDDNGEHIKFDNTGNKVGSCGPQSGRWGFGSVNTLSPGWTTFTWEEVDNKINTSISISIYCFSPYLMLSLFPLVNIACR